MEGSVCDAPKKGLNRNFVFFSCLNYQSKKQLAISFLLWIYDLLSYSDALGSEFEKMTCWDFACRQHSTIR